MKSKRARFFITILILFSANSYSQEFSTNEAIEDLQFLKKQIETFNPGTRLFTTSFSERADSLLATITEEISKYDLYKKVAQMAALSNEGHFSLGNDKDFVHSDVWNSEEPFFPLFVVIIEDSIYVYYDLSEENQLQKGDQILSINGRTSKEIITEMITYIPTDGVIPTYPRRRLTQRFPWLYHFVIEQSESYTLEVLPFGENEPKEITLEARLSNERMANYRERFKKEDDSPSINDFYELTFQESTAILTLKSFDWRLIEKYGLKAKDFYKGVFEEIEANKSEKLIIDLRDNTGGRNEFADEMVPFIRKENIEIELLSEATSWKGKRIKRKARSRSSLAFNGEIIALVNGLSYSNGSVLARYLREYGDAKIIGEESGTRYEGFVAGSQEMVTLPHSGLEIGIPRYANSYQASPKQNTVNRGLIPDVEIPLTLEMILSEEDEILNYALDD
ncbi:MAG: S41 family peptidase [Bacteroidota bacterium]